MPILRKPVKLNSLKRALQTCPPTAEKEVKPKPSLNDFSVLVIEDNIINRKVLHTALKNLGIKNVMLAVNVLEGLEKYIQSVKENKPFDMIISDLIMPGLSGISCCERIRHEEYKTKARCKGNRKRENENVVKWPHSRC